MSAARPVRVIKVRQIHAAERRQRPGQPVKGSNYVAQRVPSAKKNAGRSARSRKAVTKA